MKAVPLILAASALMMLAGCATSVRLVAPPINEVALPELPEADAARCRDPGVKAGRPALAELARQRVALAECRRRHGRVVSFYQDLRERQLAEVPESGADD